MSPLKIADLAYARMQVPDLDLAAAFLREFGLIEVAADQPRRRYFRASAPTPWCYELVEGPQRFLGFGFDITDAGALTRVAAENGLEVERSDAPGGGAYVRLTEPNGYSVDLVHGRAVAEPIAVGRQQLNTGSQPLLRKGELFRVKRGEVVPVLRLAHVVLGSPDVAGTVKWFGEKFGMLISDEVVAGPEEALVGTFMRLDAGEDFVDHHTIFVVRAPVAGLHHISFESQDVDALLAEHTRLKSLGQYEQVWGIGRHTLGSQIFDYWCDPFGYLHEHWADTDRLNAEAVAKRWEVHEGMVTQWGEPTPERVRQATRP